MSETWFCPLNLTLINLTTQRIYNHCNHLQAHEYVVRPLFIASTEAYIYRGTLKERVTSLGEIMKPIELKDESILIPQKGKYIFDKTQECITGHEYLWNVDWCRRGSIVMVLENGFDFSEIFRHCYKPCIIKNPNSGQSSGAIRFCKQAREKNTIATVLSASNGIEWLTIYASDEVFEKIYSLAESLCKSREDWGNETLNQVIN